MLSHLSWDRRLFQRPQQLARCFARRGHRVSYVSVEGFRRWMDTTLLDRVQEPSPNLTARMLPQVPGSWRIGICRSLTNRLVASKVRNLWDGSGKRVLWCQHPRFAPLAEVLKPELLVYDVMDPHRAFASAMSGIIEQERLLLKKADIVFAGGHSMAELVRGDRADVQCLPSGIDYRHFVRAAEDQPMAEDLVLLRRPVLGYFGAVDERIDWTLLESIARERPNWTLVLIGPLIKLREVPVRAPNLHYLGPKDYAVLPDYLRGFDVCLIPWVVNDLTRYMSPTKTPEYLAAGRPVVSVPIPDVEHDYRKEVLIANTTAEWIAAVEKALARGKTPPIKPAASRTWDEIAEAMLTRMKGGAGRMKNEG